MIKIEINNLTTNFFNEKFFNKKIIKKLISRILNLENCRDCSISIVIVGTGRIKKLNKKYRNKNKETDVLSFATGNDKINKFVDPTNSLGEVVICPKYIKKIIKREDNLKFKKNSVDNAFVRKFFHTLIHGILHLLGYDHKKIEEAQKMREKEDLFQKLID